jgi:HlyD family secretion protein
MRILAPLAVLTIVLAALIGYRLHTQAQVLAAPSGGSGEIEGVTVDLSSRVGARVASLFVKKGDSVRKGDLLLRLDCSEPEAQLAEAQARLAAARAQAVAAGAQITVSQRSQVAAIAGGEAAKAQEAALQAQREATERQAARLESIPTDVAPSSVDQTRASAVGLGHQVEAARAQVSASKAQANAAAGAIRAASAQAEAATAQVHAGEALVARAELFAAECEIRAPRAAAVSDLPREEGELVAPGAVLVRLIDLSDVKATFYLPNPEIGVVRPGAPAIVVADAWPGQQFKAKVRTVALEAEFTPRNIQTRTDRDRLVYPIEVTVENEGGKLRAGMPVQVILPGTAKGS